jgi:hypothetical protein
MSYFNHDKDTHLNSSRTLAQLQRDASRASYLDESILENRHPSTTSLFGSEPHRSRHDSEAEISHEAQTVADPGHSSSTTTSQLDIGQTPESGYDGSRAVSVHSDNDRHPIINPLVSGLSAYTAVNTGQTRKYKLESKV